MHIGKVHQIIGPVLDIKFNENELPALLNAIVLYNEGKKIVAEVTQHIGDDEVRCISLSSTNGLRRGMEATDTGKPIEVPIGPEVLGRMFNVLGEPIDGKGKIETAKRASIHNDPPSFAEQSTSTEIIETGIKVVELIAP